MGFREDVERDGYALVPGVLAGALDFASAPLPGGLEWHDRV